MEPIILIDGKARRPIISDMLELLTPANRMLADAYIGKLEGEYAPSHVTSLIREALKYMLRLQNNGIYNALESTVRDVVRHCSTIESPSAVLKGQRKGYLRVFVGFLSTEYGLSRSLELATGVFMYDRVAFIDDLNDHARQGFLVSASSEGAISIDRELFWDYACGLHATLESRGYSSTTKRTLHRACQCLYIFLCANDLDYTPALAEHWVKTTVIPKQGDWRACRRAFALIDHFERNGSFEPSTVNCHMGKSASNLPTWCGEPLAGYLSEKQRDGQARNSLKMQLSSNLRFCEYLIGRDITCWDELNPQIIMDFHIQDVHGSTAGKNAYNSRIRQFLDFLAEHGFVPETLRLSLPSSKIKGVSIVEVLTDEDLSAIARYKEEAEDPIELRSIGIVLLGLRLGLRGTDIVNLKLSDISWQKQEISVMQSKTAVALTLPMPIEVANCLYLYIVHGRPRTGSDAVFIRHRAPFCQLSRSACGAALSRVLGKGSEDAVGFHITRKTFASRMLSSEVPVDTIVEVLGHTTNTTVHKYLATDEVGMRSCAIPIAAVPVSGVVMSS